MGKIMALGLLLVAALPIPAAVAQTRAAPPSGWYSGEYRECDQDTTPEIVACIAGKAKAWQARVDTALGKLLNAQPKPQQARLKASQTAWTAYRDANCAFYANGEGTIARVEAAECLRVLAEQRALELEQALKP